MSASPDLGRYEPLAAGARWRGRMAATSVATLSSLRGGATQHNTSGERRAGCVYRRKLRLRITTCVPVH